MAGQPESQAADLECPAWGVRVRAGPSLGPPRSRTECPQRAGLVADRMSEAARWVSLEQALGQAAVTECPWPSGMSIHPAAPNQGCVCSGVRCGGSPQIPLCKLVSAPRGCGARERGVRVKPTAGPWGRRCGGGRDSLSNSDQIQASPGLPESESERRNPLVGLLVGIKSRKRSEPQRAMGGRGGAQHKPLLTSVPSQTPRKPLILIQLVRHPQTSYLGVSRLKVPSLQGAGAQARRENCSPLAKQTLWSSFPFCSLSPTNLKNTLMAERR